MINNMQEKESRDYKVDTAPAVLWLEHIMARMARLLDDSQVPEDQRWFVAKPEFYEELASTDSKLMSSDFNQGDGGVRNGLVASGSIRAYGVGDYFPTISFAEGMGN